jgi:hypothetical protein
MRRHFLLDKDNLKKPARTFTIGSDNCDYMSLVDALEHGVEGDMFIVFGGVHDGKLHLRKNQSIHCIGKVTLKQSADDYLFYFRQPSDYDAGNPGIFEVHWTGSLPLVQFYADSKWVAFENDFLATVDMSGLFLHHVFNFSQQNTDPLILNSITSNLIADSAWFAPVFVDTGLYGVKIFSEGDNVPPLSKQFVSLQSGSINRVLAYDRDTDAFYLDINSLGPDGNSANTCSGFLECRIPFYFENV